MIKDIAVIVDDVGTRAAPYAMSLAARFDACLTGLSFRPEPTCETLAYAEASYGAVVAARDGQLRKARDVAAQFLEAGRHRFQQTEVQVISDVAAIAEQRLLDVVRLADLVIVEQWDREAPKYLDVYVEPLLLRSGRPILVVPYAGTHDGKLGAATIAWDGSAPAARALSDAIPILSRVDRVEVVSVTRVKTSGGATEAALPLLKHLARHGIDAHFQTLASDISVADTLLSHIADTGSDLLVMGAFGHSPIMESILGGTSRSILDTMTVPVFFSR